MTGRTCTLTPLCDPNPDLRDNHPNDAGYALMAQLFFDATGYKTPQPLNETAETPRQLPDLTVKPTKL